MHSKNVKIINSLLAWIDANYPGSKARILQVIKTRNSGLGSMFDVTNIDYSLFDPQPGQGVLMPDYMPDNMPGQDDSSWFSDTLNTISDAAQSILPAYANYKLQKDAYKIQMERARRGQEPIDMTRYSPAVRVKHDLDYGAIRNQFAMSPENKDALVIGAGIIAGIIFLPKLLK